MANEPPRSEALKPLTLDQLRKRIASGKSVPMGNADSPERKAEVALPGECESAPHSKIANGPPVDGPATIETERDGPGSHAG